MTTMLMLRTAALRLHRSPLSPHSLSTRCLSTDPTFQLLSWFSPFPTATLVEQGLLLAHQTGGNWTFELMACTAAARLLISTANMTYCRKLFTTYAITMHPFREREQKFKKEMTKKLASGSLPPLMARDIRFSELSRIREHNVQLITQKNIHPAKAFVAIGLEALFWLSYAAGVRNIVAGFPPEWTATAAADMRSQGALWFPDLTAPDPYFVLPVIAASTILFSIRVSLSSC